MCGISGVVHFDSTAVNISFIQKTLAKLKHRGPDDDGIFVEDNVGLGFVRLSILDLSRAGHQPMFDISERYVMVFNGEIYNYLELKCDLESLGIKFISTSDSEVLLYSYIQWGEQCLNKFNGMFAFAIFDRKEKKLFAARDRFGVKPFYYFVDDSKFVFASEIPALISVLAKKPTINKQVVYDFMAFNSTDRDENTFYTEIKKLQHGHILKLENSKITISKWYNLSENIKDPFTTSGEYREQFRNAVALRLRSDVPVGTCLSGGLDSSSILSILLNDFGKQDMQTFSVVYGQDQTGDESQFIKLYEKSVKSLHYTQPTPQSLMEDLNDLRRIHGEPFSSPSIYAQYCAMRLASKHAVVSLDGQGADEQLAGYLYFWGYYLKELFLTGRIRLFFHELRLVYHNHGFSESLNAFVYFMLPKNIKMLFHKFYRPYIDKEFGKKHFKTSQVINAVYSTSKLKEALIQHFESKLEQLLKWADLNSMAFSVEVRMPFLDYKLVERTLATRTNLILKDGITKFLLREAMKDILPEEIRLRKEKNGFETPVNEWLRSKEMLELLNKTFRPKVGSKNEYLNYTAIVKMIDAHSNQKADNGRELWKVLCLQLWLDDNNF